MTTDILRRRPHPTTLALRGAAPNWTASPRRTTVLSGPRGRRVCSRRCHVQDGSGCAAPRHRYCEAPRGGWLWRGGAAGGRSARPPLCVCVPAGPPVPVAARAPGSAPAPVGVPPGAALLALTPVLPAGARVGARLRSSPLRRRSRRALGGGRPRLCPHVRLARLACVAAATCPLWSGAPAAVVAPPRPRLAPRRPRPLPPPPPLRPAAARLAVLAGLAPPPARCRLALARPPPAPALPGAAGAPLAPAAAPRLPRRPRSAALSAPPRWRPRLLPRSGAASPLGELGGAGRGSAGCPRARAAGRGSAWPVRLARSGRRRVPPRQRDWGWARGAAAGRSRRSRVTSGPAAPLCRPRPHALTRRRRRSYRSAPAGWAPRRAARSVRRLGRRLPLSPPPSHRVVPPAPLSPVVVSAAPALRRSRSPGPR